MRVWVLLAAIGSAFCARQRLEGSAVQKIIGMLGEMKAKVESDIETETKQMEEYMQYCDDQSTDKGNAIKTATRQIEDLKATIEESGAIIIEMSDEISTLGSTIASKSGELDEATSIRKGEHEDFKVTEKELAESVQQLGGAIVQVKKGMSLAQGKGMHLKASMPAKQLKKLVSTLGSIVESAMLTGQQKRRLKSFLQEHQKEKEDDGEDFSLKSSLRQPQAKAVAYESQSGGIIDILEETKDKAEAELSDARKAEMEAKHSYEMIRQSLESEISTMKEKLADCQSQKSANEEAKGSAEGEMKETEKSKSVDSETLETLKSECQGKAVEWEERLKSAKGEMGALDKAKEILQSGVKALIQVSVKRSSRRALHDPFMSSDADDDDDDDDDVRTKVVDKLRNLGRKFNSYSLTQVANRAKSDPFVKIRGLIEEMISKLLEEQQAEANHKAFCDEEMGKSKKALEIKTSKLGKLDARIDEGESRKVQLLEEIKNLESELAEIDRAQAEATELRSKEHSEFLKAQADYKSSEDACAQAVEVLKEYYSGSALIQVRSSSRRASMKDDQPEFGGANKDAGGSIIEFLEFAEEDFARLLAEVEGAEDKAQSAFDKLSTENKVSKATKEAEAKGKNSEVKSLTKTLTDNGEDKSGLTEELAAVNMYIEKLKPQCESKAMSASEKIAAKKAEIEGLKEALSILEGTGMFLQVKRHH
jgi:chromosome segregation ATPase